LSAGLSGWPFYTHWNYYEWVNTDPKGIDGGPLGFLSWTIPLLTGALAYDLVAAARRPAPVGRLLIWGTVLMLVGYALACLNSLAPPNTADPGIRSWLVEPPFVPPSWPVNMWSMSQRSGSVSYQAFAAGFALALYAHFALACDRGRHGISIFQKRGTLSTAAPTLTISGSGAMSLTGTVYGAYAKVSMSGSAGVIVMGGQLIADTATLTGGATISINPGTNPIANTRILGLVE
jgi:hypothetical protein